MFVFFNIVSIFPGMAGLLNINIKEVLSKLQNKYPKSSCNEKELEFHAGHFRVIEEHLNLERIAFRAVTTHIEEDGSYEMNKGLFTYHWICFRGNGPSFELYNVNYRPNPLLVRKREHVVINENRYELCKRDWQICHDEIDDFKTTEGYFEAEPDEDPCIEEELWLGKKIKDAILEARKDADGFKYTKQRAQKYIKDQFDFHLDEHQATHNNYHLARADFYRKLKVDQMSANDIIMCSIAWEGMIDAYQIEKRLRKSYTEKIDSL